VSRQIIGLSELEAREPRWLWRGHLLREAVNLFVGKRGLGKTVLAAWVAAQATLGATEWGGRPLRVFVDTREDDPRVDYRPRIEAAGGEMSLIETRRLGTAPWTFPHDLDRLGEYLRARRDQGRPIDLCLFDSLGAFVPRLTQPEQAAQALEGLTLLALEFECAFLFVHHFLKTMGRTIDSAIGGAGAVQRIARTIHLFGEQPRNPLQLLVRRARGQPLSDEVDGARILACTKLNVAARPASLRFTLEVVSLPAVEQVPVLRLDGESAYNDLAVFEQACQPPVVDATSELEAACEWAVAYLLDSPLAYARPTQRLLADGKHAGFSQRTLERARTKIGLLRIPPAKLCEHLGQLACAQLDEEERAAWWVALPDFIPPPEQWQV
jgi:hypothetical protein